MLKKKHISILVAVAAIGAAAVTSVVIKMNSNTILSQNVEALMEQEYAYGKCDNSTTSVCVGVCSDCGKLVYAEGYYGKGYDIHH